MYQKRLPTAVELRHWWGPHTGIGLVCGCISGNLECLDFDSHAIYAAFCDACQAAGLSALLARLQAGYEERTPNGVHLPYRCSQIAGSTKLAGRPDGIDDHGHPKVKTLIETKGEGGYIVIAPSSGAAHPDGLPYVLIRGDLDSIVTISPEERSDLLTLARTFDEMPRHPYVHVVTKGEGKQPAGPRPGRSV
jgi:putative DNA primase/helicase